MKRFLLLLGFGILVFIGCAADKETMVTVGVPGDVTLDELNSLSVKKATILQNAAIVLRAEKLEREADLADKLSTRILEILSRGEDDLYLASWPGGLLSGYAERLKKWVVRKPL